MIYETDEEEFMEPGQDDVKPAVCSFTAMYTVHSTQYTVRRPVRNTARRKTAVQSGPNLAYFTLWWKRMEVEGRKEAKMKRSQEEEDEIRRRKAQSIFVMAGVVSNVTDIRTDN